MSDLNFITRENLLADLNKINNDIEGGSGLESAVSISLLTDARDQGCKGWYGTAIDNSFEIGSKLWTLFQKKITTQTILECERYIRSALQWMIDDNVVGSININIETNYMNRVDVKLELTKPTGENTSIKYELNWVEQIIKRGIK